MTTKTEAIKAVALKAADISAISLTAGTIVKVLPPIAALFAIIWYAIGYYEKVTGNPFSNSKLARWIRRGD